VRKGRIGMGEGFLRDKEIVAIDRPVSEEGREDALRGFDLA